MDQLQALVTIVRYFNGTFGNEQFSRPIKMPVKHLFYSLLIRSKLLDMTFFDFACVTEPDFIRSQSILGSVFFY